MGGSSTPKAQSMAGVLKAYADYIPALAEVTGASMPGLATNQLNATLATQPLYNASNLQQAQQYALPLAEVGANVQRANALSGAYTNLEQMEGPGAAIAQRAEQLARATNPNYYKVQDDSSQQAQNLMRSFNMGGLSAGEQNSVERATNQGNANTGNLGNNNALNTVSNAMNFGQEFHNKQNRLGQALGAANQTATSAQNTGFNPVNLALGQPNASTMGNFGTGTFSNTSAGTQAGTQGNALGFGSSVLGTMGGMNNSFTGAQSQQAVANSAPAYMGAAGSILSAA